MDRSDSVARAVLRPPGARWWWLALIATAACNHSAPFQPGDDAPGGPRDPALPARVTLSPDPDLTPAPAAANAGWLYAYTERTAGAVNRCLAGLPLEGGSRNRTYCDVTLGRPGVNSSLTWPAEGADGRLAFLRTRGVGFGGAQTSAALVLGSFAPRDSGRVLRSFPYPAAGTTAQGVSHLSWLDSHTLIFVATQVEYRCIGLTCGSLDTLESGLQVERLDVDHPPAAPDVMAGTDRASSVSPIADGSGFYFTVGGDTRVYRRHFSTGATDTVYDFGGAGIARDVQQADSVLYAIVGGNVGVDSVSKQFDHGGSLLRVDLRSGALSTVNVAGQAIRHPILQATQHRIMVETGTPSPDLWLAVTP